MNAILSPFKKPILLCLLLIGVLVSCDNEQNTEPDGSVCNPSNVAGELLSSEYAMTITPDQLNQYLSGFGAPIGFNLDYSADAYKLSYLTRDKAGNLVPASGVLFVPQGLDTLDLISVQHGTVTRRSDVGSVNPYFAFEALIMAMKGYMTVAPDYLGLGDSDMLHPYLHAQLSANTVIDILRATRIYACENEVQLSDKLFLSGYSEGGFVTLATQKEIETHYSDEFELTGVAPMAGPFDLSGNVRRILEMENYENPVYLAYMVIAYNDVYDWNRLNQIFNEPYASQLPLLFDGNSSGDTINEALTTSIDSLFNSEFVTSFLAGEETEFNAALVENSFDGWGPIAPVLLVHGTADETVAYENSEVIYTSMTENGGLSVSLVPIPGADHLTGALASLFIALDWIGNF